MLRRESKESPLIAVSSSKIHRRGVFASKLILKGKFIIEYTGEKIRYREGVRRDKLQELKGAFYVFRLNKQWSVDGATGGDARLINHSCNPNCIYRRRGGKIWICARRNIRKGEELSYDYDATTTVDHSCRCGSRNCKGFI